MHLRSPLVGENKVEFAKALLSAEAVKDQQASNKVICAKIKKESFYKETMTTLVSLGDARQE